jgi:hypothetical protein
VGPGVAPGLFYNDPPVGVYYKLFSLVFGYKSYTLNFIFRLQILLYFSFPIAGSAQQLNYIHYDTKDGLAGSTVYDICQDKDGFIWFATENGLSRFDGATFKNFTVADGLPDNEVLKLFADSKGRVWIGTFSKEVCYYFNGVIYNTDNDTLVKSIELANNVMYIDEDTKGSVIICDHKKIVTISKTNKVSTISDREEFKRLNSSVITAFPDYYGDGICVVTDSSVYRYINGQFYYFYQVPNIKDTYVPLSLSPDGKVKDIQMSDPVINTTYRYYTAQYIGTTNGGWMIDTTNFLLQQQFLPGKKVSRIIQDSETNLWFSTLGEGIFKLASKNINTLKFNSIEDNTEVFSLSFYDGKILAGLNSSKAVLVDYNNGAVRKQEEFYFASTKFRSNRAYCVKTLDFKTAILGFDKFIVKLEGGRILKKPIIKIKSIEKISDEEIVVGTGSYTFKVRLRDLKITDTLWRGRCTKVYYHDKNFYVAALNGLYIIEKDKTYRYLGNLHPALKRRINDIKTSSNGTLWVATNDAGIVGFRNDTMVAIIDERNGLSSNMCKTLFLCDHYLWVGTNKGLNKINLGKTNFPIIKYSTSDGLASDIVNSIFVNGSDVWLGSPAGLTYFNESQVSKASICNIKLLSVSVSEKQLGPGDFYNLSYKDNNISFEYAGISFKSGGDIRYRYKLNGLDKDWKETRLNTLSYQSLPGGNYGLELFAVNKFGVKSKIIHIGFFVAQPFWKSWWFFLGMLLLAIGCTWWIVNRRNKKLRTELEKQNKIEHQFMELEQKALQAQMNPHFIFNCLNSIQRYMLTGNKVTANEYLTGFASLIRQTLDNSEKKTITVAEEISYLKKYLEMEKMRFEDNFVYTISGDPSIETDFTEMPALLLQPFVENCLRHGIRYKEKGLGKVDISFLLEEDKLCWHIKDNGVGRKKAAELKSLQHIEYQSKGMKLTEKRVMLLNKTRNNQISVEIFDLVNSDNTPCGTEVIIKIPI